MTKKQRQEIAKIWAGSVLLNFGIDSFGKDVLNEDAGAIIQTVHQIGKNILKDRIGMSDLEKIIEHVLTPQNRLKILFAQADEASGNLKELFGGMRGRKICSNCGIDYNETDSHSCPQ